VNRRGNHFGPRAKGVYSQIKLDSGEKVLISIANDIKIFKLKFFGTIPSQTVWEFSDLYQFADLLRKNGYSAHPLDVLVEKVKDYYNIEQLQKELKNFVAELESKN
jgi:hypothetical protein